MKNFNIFILLAILFLILISCSRTESVEDTGINLEIVFDEPLYEKSFLNIGYNWSFPSPSIEFNENMRVFVHFWNLDQDRMILQDDHDLPFSGKSWNEGEDISYSHKIFIPDFIKYLDKEGFGKENIRINAGLYNPSDSSFNVLLYTGKYTASTLPYKYPRVIFHDGWHMEEKTAENRDETFRWTKDKADMLVDSLGMDMEFHIKGTVFKHILPDQRIQIFVNDTLLEEFIPEENTFYKVYTIPEEMIQDSRTFFIHIKTDRTFIPKETGLNDNDYRELGLMINWIFFQGLGNK